MFAKNRSKRYKACSDVVEGKETATPGFAEANEQTGLTCAGVELLFDRFRSHLFPR